MVEDIECSVAFYQGKLGFEVAGKWDPTGKLAWRRLVRDRSAIMLQQACEEDGSSADRGWDICFFFNCDDAARMHAELGTRGLHAQPPKAAFYGMNQFFLRDPDGYELCFQSAVTDLEGSQSPRSGSRGD